MIRRLKMKGVDLSHWNRNVNFEELAKEVDFVILKIGGEETEAGKLTMDKTFYRRCKAAREAGLHVGGYFFMSTKPEVFCTYPDHICGQLADALEDVCFDMPLYIDVEGQPLGYKTKLTEYVVQWCRYMESLNYFVGIYGSDVSTFHDRLDIGELKPFSKWVARYGKEPEYVDPHDYFMWQCSRTAEVKGVSGKCDLDYAYLDFPTVIKKKGLNI